MSAPICVPYHRDSPERMANWLRTREQWHGHEVFVGGGEPFSRARACNQAAERAGAWEVAIFCDSDILLGDPAQAKRAADLALEIKGYVVCFETLYYLGQAAALRVREGVEPQASMAQELVGLIWGGAFAIHRELWDVIGGFDESFVTWGEEDTAFLARVNDLGVKERVSGAAFHLWHPLVEGAR